MFWISVGNFFCTIGVHDGLDSEPRGPVFMVSTVEPRGGLIAPVEGESKSVAKSVFRFFLSANDRVGPSS